MGDQKLDFGAVVERPAGEAVATVEVGARPGGLFAEDAEISPTWTEGGTVYHTVERCSRLQGIRKNRRVTGRPGVGMRMCFNCEDIVRTKRRG